MYIYGLLVNLLTVEDPCIDNQCDANANCLPQDAGYSCQCNSGFEGNGFYCEGKDQ